MLWLDESKCVLLGRTQGLAFASTLFFDFLRRTNRLLYKVGPIAQLWLERTPDKREVGSSTLPRPTIIKWGR